MIKVFSFVGSCAGSDGRTAKLSNDIAEAIRRRAAAEGEEVVYERVTGAELRVDFCRSCQSCFFHGVCPLDAQDDMAMLKKKMFDCDILLFASPVYLGRMSGLSKAVVDRLSYWAHRFELLGKPCLSYVTTHSNHGEEALDDLNEVLRSFGASVVSGGAFYASGHPNLYLADELEPVLAELADRLMEAYHDPRVTITQWQQQYHLSLVRLCRRALARERIIGAEARDEARVCERRGLTRYVLMSEAVEDLCMKPDGSYRRERSEA